MKQLFLLPVSLFLLCITTYAQQETADRTNLDSLRLEIEKVKAANREVAAGMQFQYFVTRSENHSFGYDVYADGNLYLHQPAIPAITGNSGFADTLAAGKVARLAIQKIKEGEIPPTLTIEELKKLKAIP